MIIKAALRKSIGELKQLMALDEILEKSDKIAEKLLNLDVFRKAETIFAYMAADQEVRTIPIIEAAWTAGKKVAVPRVLSKQDMEFFYIDNFDNMTKGYGGISEPLESSENLAEPESVLMIMPGLAFDRHGNRLGHGRGYYDIYLVRHSNADICKVALCYDFQLVDEVPAFSWDEKTDYVITEREVIKVS